MFINRPAKNTELDDVIEQATRELKSLEASNENYAKTLEQLAKLIAMRDGSHNRVSKDTLLMVAGNLAGILVIVGHERAHIVTSKAISFVGKFK